MKKTIFTFCSVAVVCCAIFFACAKDDNSMPHVTYVSQTNGGTGGNPNPNGLPSNSGYGSTTATTATTGTTTGSTTSSTTTPSSTLTINGTANSMTSVGSAVSGYYQVVTKPSSGSSSNPQVTLVFATLSAPPTGSYNVINTPPTTGLCQFVFNDASGNSGSPTAGSVSITAGSPNVCTFSNLTCTCGGTTYTLSGTFNY